MKFSADDLKMQFDMELQGHAIANVLTTGQMDTVRTLLASVVDVVREYENGLRAAERSGRFTARGIGEERERLQKIAAAKLADIEKQSVGGIDARIQFEVQKAFRKETETSEDRLLAYLQEKEMRDLLKFEDPLIVQESYLAAVRNNDNDLYVRAVERAPKGFPLVNAETSAKARELRIEQIPEMNVLGTLHRTYTSALATAKQAMDLDSSDVKVV